MSPFRSVLLSLLLFALPALACLAERPCYTPAQALDLAGKDICVQAHVYGIDQGADGTRSLDVCAPGTLDSSCRFGILSMAEDRAEVGSLESLLETDIKLRGTVHAVHGEAFILLSSARQLHGGTERFRPNPALLRGFGADTNATAFRDPSMEMHHRHGTTSFTGSATASRVSGPSTQ